MNINRVFWIVLDSMGIGEMPDAAEFGDEGSNTLASIAPFADLPNLTRLGLFNIDGVTCGNRTEHPRAAPVENDREGLQNLVRQLARFARKDQRLRLRP